jgi:hypothetical protein
VRLKLRMPIHKKELDSVKQRQATNKSKVPVDCDGRARRPIGANRPAKRR